MGYTEALSFDRNAAVRPAFDAVRSAESTSKEPIDFSKVFEKYSDGIEDMSDIRPASEAEQRSTFFTGAAVDMSAAMSQITEPAFHEELDSAISFDEISELDDITDTTAAIRAAEYANDRFRGFDELSDALSAEEDEEEDLDMFSDLEELII